MLLVKGGSLVKTRKFGKPAYIGDPANTMRIFNELEVDELMLLDISATRQRRAPLFDLLEEVADECFMPLGYGGGLTSREDCKRVFDIGFEKVVINTQALVDPAFVSRLARDFGSQAVVCAIDVRRDLFSRPHVFMHSVGRNAGREPVEWAKELEARGAGEILLTSVDREGTWSGCDLELTRAVSGAVGIPVIAHGGVGGVADIGSAVQCGASAVGVGSMFVYQREGMGVLINRPARQAIDSAIHGA
jgi:cyclase